MDNQNDYDFGGRIKPKTNEPIDWTNLVDLPNVRMAFIYQRLSTHEQVKKHLWSIEAQDGLVELAHRDGYPNDMIYLEQRDLGISGTKGREERPGLAYLIQQVEAGFVEAIYVVHISRLYRDQTLINALALGELFKEHNVIIVTPQMRLNLKDKMHMRLYRMEIEPAADELDLMTQRLNGAKDLKARAGRYSGENIPPGYVIDTDKQLDDGRPNPNYHSYKIYEPHAKVVRLIFERMAMPGATPTRVARYCQQHGIVFLPFIPEFDTPANRKSFARNRLDAERNWLISVFKVRSIATNPTYLGWRVWKDEIVSNDAFPPIIDEAVFWAAQGRFNSSSKSFPKKDFDLAPLAGILYCGNHDIPHKMTYHNNRKRKTIVYECREAYLQLSCVRVTDYILEKPISEAVINQIALPGMAEEVLNKLTDEYKRLKEQAASYRREVQRLESEIENLRHNLVSNTLSSDTLSWIDQQIQERLARIRELANLENQPIGAAIGQATPEKADLCLVQSFLENLETKWAEQPNNLKNAFLCLILNKVIIWPESTKIRVKLFWRVGLEQELMIYRSTVARSGLWDNEELTILREHYETLPKDKLMELLPGRSWDGILAQARKENLPRRCIGRPAGVYSPQYTPEDDELVRQYYQGEIGLEQVLATGRNINSIRNRAKRLGLKRSQGVTWEWINPIKSQQEGSSG